MKHQLYMMITAGLLGANVSGWANPSGPETKASVTSPDQELLGNTLQDTMKVNLPFRQVAKEDLMSGISVVDMEDLIQKDYSTYSLDNLSAFVSGYTGNVWGQDGVLVLVDGVPRDANNILPTEISQITVLKSLQPWLSMAVVRPRERSSSRPSAAIPTVCRYMYAVTLPSTHRNRIPNIWERQSI